MGCSSAVYTVSVTAPLLALDHEYSANHPPPTRFNTDPNAIDRGRSEETLRRQDCPPRSIATIGSGARDCAPAPSHTTGRAVFRIRRLEHAL